MKQKSLFYLMLVILLCCLTSCSRQSKPSVQDTIEKPTIHYRIGICQIGMNGYEESLTQGFQEAVDQAVPDAQITILTKNIDQIDTLASQCLELDRAGLDLLFLAITGNAVSIDTSGFQTPYLLTPTCDVTRQVADTLHQLLPDINQLGILYHSTDPSATAKAKKMMEYLDAEKVPYQKYPFADITSFYSGANDICDQCDAAYIPSDLLSVDQSDKLKDIFLPAGIPLISDHSTFHDISMATVSLDYYNLGYQIGKRAADALQNKTTPDLSGINAADFIVQNYNRKLCEDFEIPLPE